MCYHLCNSKTPYRPLFIIHIDSWVYLTQLSSKSSREDMCLLSTSFLLNIQSGVKQKVDMPRRFKTAFHNTVLHTDVLCQNIRKLASVVPEKNVTEIIL